MPRRLNRKSYGWSYTFGKEARSPSEKYKKNFDAIKWENEDFSHLPTRKTRFGIARVKVFKDELVD